MKLSPDGLLGVCVSLFFLKVFLKYLSSESFTRWLVRKQWCWIEGSGQWWWCQIMEPYPLHPFRLLLSPAFKSFSPFSPVFTSFSPSHWPLQPFSPFSSVFLSFTLSLPLATLSTFSPPLSTFLTSLHTLCTLLHSFYLHTNFCTLYFEGWWEGKKSEKAGVTEYSDPPLKIQVLALIYHVKQTWSPYLNYIHH